ncbi:MAG TPA: DUF1643 domain-containing protein [Coleofasciculaceae cyanobacterium]
MQAVFDRRKRYRYSLSRQWEEDGDRIAFIMLNPSTADDQNNDPTIRRCIRFAQAWGYGSLEVVNLFALRATHPQQLRQVEDPVGVECDRYILQAVRAAESTVIAWGNWGRLQNRDRAVLALLSSANVHCLGVNQSGQPRHPLYLKATAQPVQFTDMYLDVIKNQI